MEEVKSNESINDDVDNNVDNANDNDVENVDSVDDDIDDEYESIENVKKQVEENQLERINIVFQGRP